MITISYKSLGLIRGHEIGPITNIIRLRNNKEQEPQARQINSKSFYYLTLMLFSLGLGGMSPPPFISVLPLSNKTKPTTKQLPGFSKEAEQITKSVCACECMCVHAHACGCVYVWGCAYVVIECVYSCEYVCTCTVYVYAYFNIYQLYIVTLLIILMILLFSVLPGPGKTRLWTKQAQPPNSGFSWVSPTAIQPDANS